MDAISTIDPWAAPDGTPLWLRPLVGADAPALQALIESLSPRDRRWRFHGAVTGVSPSWLARLAADGAPGRVALAAFAQRGGAPMLVAEVRCEAAPGSADAEFALAVAPGWRRIGVGQRCLAALRRAASAQGLRWLHGTVLADNAPMLALMRRCGFRCEPDRRDVRLVAVEARVEAATAHVGRLAGRCGIAREACHAR